MVGQHLHGFFPGLIPSDDLDRFEARRRAEYLAMIGILDIQTYKSFIEYTSKIGRLDTLRDWMFNILEMIHDGGFVPGEREQSERIVKSVGCLGLYPATITENFLTDVYETRLSELSPIMKASFGLAMLEERDTGGSKNYVTDMRSRRFLDLSSKISTSWT